MPIHPSTLTAKMTERQMQAIWDEAKFEGLKAGNAHTPTPMVVGTPTTPFGNDIDPTQRTYYVADGMCGFAWVTVMPGTSRFARWLKRKGYADKAYGGGVSAWVHEHNQSYERKQRHARAMADVFVRHGINAYAQSRLD